jgi:hypothetical protein
MAQQITADVSRRAKRYLNASTTAMKVRPYFSAALIADIDIGRIRELTRAKLIDAVLFLVNM